MSKQIVYNIIFRNENGEWFNFHDENGKAARMVSNKPPEIAAQYIWDAFRVRREIHSDYYKLGVNVKVVPNQKLTDQMELRQRNKQLKKYKIGMPAWTYKGENDE